MHIMDIIQHDMSSFLFFDVTSPSKIKELLLLRIEYQVYQLTWRHLRRLAHELAPLAREVPAKERYAMQSKANLRRVVTGRLFECLEEDIIQKVQAKHRHFIHHLVGGLLSEEGMHDLESQFKLFSF